MPQTIVFATAASPQPMGQQAYEEAIADGLGSRNGQDLLLRRRVVRSMRSSLPGDVRLPMHRIQTSAAAAAAGAAWAYRGADLVHRCDLRLPPALRPDREVVTIHDLAFELYPDEGRVPPFAKAAARRSRIVIAPSKFSANQLRERWNLSDVRAISNGVDAVFTDHHALTTADRQRLRAPGRYVMHAGGCSLRKNLQALAAAWQRLLPSLPDVTLVLAGPPDPRRTDLFGPLPQTSLVGRLPRDLQVRAVQSASAVVVPSLYEGFGLPALEAMVAGVPVVAADRASLPEVCGDAALLVRPDDAGLADGLAAVLEDASLEMRLREAGPRRAADFNWETSVDAHVAVYHEVLADPEPRSTWS